jgi:NAD(P)-dependent dehydrogenase (short-subunit alcohol dehydrogenase family)
MQIAQHAFFVSGGGSGLGAACARRIASVGGRVLIADLNETAGQALADELGEAAVFVRTDVTDQASAEQAIEVAIQRFGSVSGAILCAGVALAQRVLGKEGPHSLEAFERVLRINVTGTFNCIRLTAAVMANNPPEADGERGVIINTASCAAFDGQIGQAAYSASKAAVVGMTLPIARELARAGIRVMTIAPGTFDTPMLAGLPEAARESLAQQVPFPSRLGRPEEYAALAQHIIENSMLNGEVIRLDGALRMGPK